LKPLYRIISPLNYIAHIEGTMAGYAGVLKSEGKLTLKDF